MKKLVKKGSCYCFSLLEIIISLLSSQTNKKIDENNVRDYLNPDCDSVYNYIDNNLSYFVDEYNKTVTDNNYFNATYIENYFDVLVNVDGDNQKGIFIDFDKDNGYALLIDNYEFLDFKTKGESPYLNIDLNYRHVFTNNNYYYIDDNDELLPTDESKNYTEKDFICSSKIYPGQTNEGCGTIVDDWTYINNYYGWRTNAYVYYDVTRDVNLIASLTEFTIKNKYSWLKWLF